MKWHILAHIPNRQRHTLNLKICLLFFLKNGIKQKQKQSNETIIVILPFPVALYYSSLMAIYILTDHRDACMVQQ